MSLKQIAIDLLDGKLPAIAADDLARARLSVCGTCPNFTKISRQCKLCGCFMDLKVKMLRANCPAGFW